MIQKRGKEVLGRGGHGPWLRLHPMDLGEDRRFCYISQDHPGRLATPSSWAYKNPRCRRQTHKQLDVERNTSMKEDKRLDIERHQGSMLAEEHWTDAGRPQALDPRKKAEFGREFGRGSLRRAWAAKRPNSTRITISLLAPPFDESYFYSIKPCTHSPSSCVIQFFQYTKAGNPGIQKYRNMEGHLTELTQAACRQLNFHKSIV